MATDLALLRHTVRTHHLPNESEETARLLDEVPFDAAARGRVHDDARALVEALRRDPHPGLMELFLAEYGLSTREGVALMCLAEALMRVPDADNIDALIRDKIAPGDWGRHLGRSGSSLVNASTWGLMLTGKMIDDGPDDLRDTLRTVVRRLSEPVVRRAVARSMKVLAHQFVRGRSIAEALEKARDLEARGFTYSYDMLGEAARTAAQAKAYFLAYAKAIAALAERATADSFHDNPGISVKLSALHPRYEFAQHERVMAELSPRIASLAVLAKNANIGLTIDAEESDRLDLSLDVIEAVLANPELKGWDGFGVVVQAYMPRAPFVIDWLAALAENLGRRICVRLVKGAYWDTEIKRAQVLGLDAYPVFTHKAATDACYLVAAKKLLTLNAWLYPQFATHNAHTAAAILTLAGKKGGAGEKDGAGEKSRAGDATAFEFQRLHGMGEALHTLLHERHGARCRIYAPVGVHKDLLAYLVRRLLENGANGSFVNQIHNKAVAPADIVRDPFDALRTLKTVSAPHIPLPPALYGPKRANAKGWELADPIARAALEKDRQSYRTATWRAEPVIDGKARPGAAHAVVNPAHHTDHVGHCVDAAAGDVEAALSCAQRAFPAWRDRPSAARAQIVAKIADLYEENATELMVLAAREAGKTLPDAIAEVREAVDFCRYYALRARALGGRVGRGVFVCISPWNFPLAIFTGQIVAALAAGNAVIAKPAEQTSLIAARAAALMHEAGVPGDVLNFLPGGGEVGAALTRDGRLAGVCFTGSTDTARAINRAMAEFGDPDAVLIAETGGLNAMIVDSTALPEQAVRDILASAFQSAGQRCSSLRLLCVQNDIADDLTAMVQGAMAELTTSDPWDLSCDIGPVIDNDAFADISTYAQRQKDAGRLIFKTPLDRETDRGTFIAPTLLRVDAVDDLKREVFGPVLHVLRYKAADIDGLIDAINAQGYGLTLGVHTRIDRRVARVCARAHVGNLYVNRNQIGAVVGVQPFGGEGLSGTGPKAGGPHYLTRFTRPRTAPGQTLFDPMAQHAPERRDTPPPTETNAVVTPAARAAQQAWDHLEDRESVLLDIVKNGDPVVAAALSEALARTQSLDFTPVSLPGPTGESNRISLHGRGVIACLGPTPEDALRQAAVALATGNGVILAMAVPDALRTLPEGLVNGVADADTAMELDAIAAVAIDGDRETRRAARRAVAARNGAILPLLSADDDAVAFVTERVLCIDTTAAGGNATLLANAAAPSAAPSETVPSGLDR